MVKQAARYLYFLTESIMWFLVLNISISVFCSIVVVWRPLAELVTIIERGGGHQFANHSRCLSPFPQKAGWISGVVSSLYVPISMHIACTPRVRKAKPIDHASQLARANEAIGNRQWLGNFWHGLIGVGYAILIVPKRRTLGPAAISKNELTTSRKMELLTFGTKLICPIDQVKRYHPYYWWFIIIHHQNITIIEYKVVIHSWRGLDRVTPKASYFSKMV